MKRYVWPKVISDDHGGDEELIFLVPENSVRYTFRPRSYDAETYSDDNLPSRMLRVNSSHDMAAFIEKYAYTRILPHGVEGVIDWVAVKNDADGLEFKWYRPYWKCHKVVRQLVADRHLWEWYSNISEPSGFVWSRETTV